MSAGQVHSIQDCGEQKRRWRVFFALWPGAETREALVQASQMAVQRSAGCATPRANLHVTLAFLGVISAAELARVQELSSPPVGRFVLNINTLGLRKRTRLLWAAPGTVPSELLALESWLWDRLAELGMARQRHGYLPHVTLARKARHVGDTLQPVRWPVAEFALVESTLGPPNSVYRILKVWPLVTSSCVA